MSAETAAYSTLSGSAPVTALVGTRIYPDIVPQEHPLPAIALARIDTEYVTTIHGGEALASFVTLEVHCLASSRAAAEQLADTVELAIPAGGFRLIGRQPHYDAEAEVCAAVLTVGYWQ